MSSPASLAHRDVTPTQPRYPAGFQMTDTSGGGNTVFVYGLLGIVFCQLLAPLAWLKGNEYVRTCAAMGVAPSGLGVTGRVLGIAGTVLNGLVLVGLLVSLVLGSLR